MNNSSPASRNLAKYGLLLAFFLYMLYEFVAEFLRGNSEGFTLPILLIGVVILGGGCAFAGVLTLRAWRESQAEAAAAIHDDEEAETVQVDEEAEPQ